MAVRLSVSSEMELHLLQELAKGNIDFSKLSPEYKLMLYQSDFDIGEVVPQEDIREFEKRYMMEESPEGRHMQAVRAAREFLSGVFRLGD